MKRFRFPLRPVAVLRAHRELRAREAFAAAVHAYVQAEEQLAGTRQRLAALGGALFDHRAGAFAPAEAAAQFRAYRAECEEEVQAERRAIAARDAMQQRRADYLAAGRELKVVEKLEERARHRHRAAHLRDEQAALDEYAGYRAARRVLLS